MNLNLYDNKLTRIAIIGSNYKSCLWSEGYNTIQNFTVEFDNTTEYRAKVKPDTYVGRDDRKTLMVIKSVQIKSDSIVASGKQAARVLDDVASVGTIASGSFVDKAIKDAYNNSNKYGNIEILDSNLGVKYNHQISNKSILELCLAMCQGSDVGFRLIRQGGKPYLEFYRPPQNPNLIFSEKFGNLRLDSLKISNDTEKNYIIVLGQGTGTDRTRIDLDYTNGEQRRELIVDARDIQQEEGETQEKYLSRLEARGYEKFLISQKVSSCSFSPYANDFGVKYDLGDILTVYLSDYDVKMQARVSKFTQKIQRNSISTVVEVGSLMIAR